jgi:hypothetical protein
MILPRSLDKDPSSQWVKGEVEVDLISVPVQVTILPMLVLLKIRSLATIWEPVRDKLLCQKNSTYHWDLVPMTNVPLLERIVLSILSKEEARAGKI